LNNKKKRRKSNKLKTKSIEMILSREEKKVYKSNREKEFNCSSLIRKRRNNRLKKKSRLKKTKRNRPKKRDNKLKESKRNRPRNRDNKLNESKKE
jgi:hypothetical protein